MQTEYNLFCSIGFIYTADYCLFYLAAIKESRAAGE